MDIVSPIVNVCFQCWDCTDKYRLYVRGLPKYLHDLQMKRDELGDLTDGITVRVNTEDQRFRVPKPEVCGWLKRAEEINKEADDILNKGNEVLQKNCLGGRCHANYRSRYKLAKQAEEMAITLVKQLDNGRMFGDVAYDPIGPSAVVAPQEPPVGMELIFANVWRLIEDDNIRSIGLYGIGGVGKTTLLRKIHSHVLEISHSYNPILWVVVSRPVNVENIQKAIWRQLKFSDDEWEKCSSKEERVIKMQNFLHKRKFVLFLDDLWERIDLPDVGIPPQSVANNSKIVFTTRSEEVCELMKASKKVMVECLTPEKALDLFREKVGEETWKAHPRIPELAETIVKECKFLPLALVTVGSAMTSKKRLHHWEAAVEILQRRPLEFRDMQDKVLSILEFSYSNLPDDIHRRCFLYCSLFPEDFEIEVDQLVNLWIGEGFVDTSIDIHQARQHYEDVIEDLISGCLLESSFDRIYRKHLKMHDLIREMAIWVASEHGNASGKVLLPENHRSIALHEFERWKDAEIISVMLEDTEVKEFPRTLTCLHLCTLILRNTNIESFPRGFFSSMPSLKVLDLMLNRKLREIPRDIGCLPNLEYLNLTQTNVTKLPKEFKNLVRLRLLFLETGVYIPKGILLDLPSLRVCVFRSFDYFIHASIPEEEKPELNLLDELNNMKEGSEVSLLLVHASEVEKLQRSPKLQSCIRNLFIHTCEALTSARLSASRMKHMVKLVFVSCYNLEEIHIRESGIGKDDESGDEEELQLSYYYSASGHGTQGFGFHNLRHLEFYECDRISHLTSLILCAPNLEVLVIRNCFAMTEIVKGDIPENQVNRIFSCLTFLHLEYVCELKSICGRPLPFASLKRMRVFGCQTLKKLPFDSNSFPNDTLESIKGDNVKWWEGLEWDHDPPTKQLLAPKFKMVG